MQYRLRVAVLHFNDCQLIADHALVDRAELRQGCFQKGATELVKQVGAWRMDGIAGQEAINAILTPYSFPNQFADQ